MFFIQNSEGIIVAADKDFLDAAGFESLLLLAEHFRTEHIGPDPEHGLLELDDTTYTFAVRNVQTLWGEGLLFEQDASSDVKTAGPETSDTVSDSEEDLPLVFDAVEEREALIDESVQPESETAPAEPESSQEETPELASKEEETLDDVLELMDLEEIEEATRTAETDRHPDTAAEEEPDSPGLKEAALGGAAGLGAAAALKAAESFLSDKEELPTQTGSEESKEEEDKDELLELLDLSEVEEETPDETTDTGLHDEIARLFDEAEKEQASLEADEAEAEPLGLINQNEEESAKAEADEEPLELYDLAEPRTETDLPDTEAREKEEAPELFDLIEPGTPHDATDIHQKEATEEHAHDREPSEELPPVQTAGIAYEQNARLIGISTGEYLTFLAQFVDESYRFEPDLRGRDLREFRSSLTSLKDASQLLHLPQLTEKLRKLEEATSDEKESIVDDYYTLIEQIKEDLKAHESSAPLEIPVVTEPTVELSDEKQRHEEDIDHPKPTEEPPLELLSDEPAPEEPIDIEHKEPSISSSETVSATLMSMQEVDSLLEKATPIPFDFSTNVASEELGLPEALVGEFVDDFIEQARENIPLILSSHQKGDMATVQSTAHLLKGAAANLRIDPLAKTLETLQHNEDPEKVPALFDRFVGQLKALKNLLHPHGLN